VEFFHHNQTETTGTYVHLSQRNNRPLIGPAVEEAPH
jgi:hypothetical protein